MQSNSAKRASIYLGVFMAVVLIAGIFLPLIRQNEAAIVPEPSETPLPTFPAPPADLTTINFDKVYLHPSGVFSIGQPDGWTASPPNKGPTIAQVNLINNDMLAVVDSYIEATPVSEAELSAHFTEQAIASSWSNFTTWQESSRSTDADGRLTIDFSVTLTGRTYVARQLAWTDGTWIYVVRVLVPENATDLLRYLLDNFAATLAPQTQFQGTPLDWDGYYDPITSHIIRYPSTWILADSAPGRPASITSADGETLRVESRAGTSVADEAAATAWVEGTASGINVTSVVPVTRLLGQGFSVAYTSATVDGGKTSGLAVLLNGPDGTLHIANLQFPASDVDLNTISARLAEPAAEATPEATAEAAGNPEYAQLTQVMETFYVIEPLNLSAQSLPPTPTPLPSLTPTNVPATAEVTAEATVESTEAAVATEAATVEATPAPAATEAATIEATDEATPEVTPEATSMQ
jgi:hypothetical protein